MNYRPGKVALGCVRHDEARQCCRPQLVLASPVCSPGRGLAVRLDKPSHGKFRAFGFAGWTYKLRRGNDETTDEYIGTVGGARGHDAGSSVSFRQACMNRCEGFGIVGGQCEFARRTVDESQRHT